MCMQVKKQQLELDIEQCKMPGWMNPKLQSRLRFENKRDQW